MGGSTEEGADLAAAAAADAAEAAVNARLGAAAACFLASSAFALIALRYIHSGKKVRAAGGGEMLPTK